MDLFKSMCIWILMFTTQTCFGRRNVLFLVADDMRPELGAYYGKDFPSPVHPPIHSPNLDKLAAKSLLLKRAYCQQALCSPSRTSLLTGRRPDTTHVYDLETYWRESAGNFTTIPQYFKENGYTSIGMGKIFHPGIIASGGDDPISWSEPYFHAKTYWETREHSWRAIPDNLLKDKPLVDEQTAERAIQTLRKVAPEAQTGGKPFFLAVGFHRPHLPFDFPESFLQYYPEASIRIPDNEYAPVNMPYTAWSAYEELRFYADIQQYNLTGTINSTIPDKVVKELRRAYYSAVSWTDSLIGRVIGELDGLGLANNTIISFWGDHGWQLGEHGEWSKHTNFEIATHAPMMVHIPGLTDAGVATEKIVEFVDLFPTLVEAAGLPELPLCPEDSFQIRLCREGVSWMPLVKNSSMIWKNASFSQFPRYIAGHSIMGYTIRTEKYRYTEWVLFQHAPIYRPVWAPLYGAELYDHKLDPEENRNVFSDPAYYQVREQLSKDLHAGWRNALPGA